MQKGEILINIAQWLKLKALEYLKKKKTVKIKQSLFYEK